MTDRRIKTLPLWVGLTAIMIAACSPQPANETTRAETCPTSNVSIGTFVQIPPGSFEKGAKPIYPEEAPTLRLQVSGFELLSHEVTNAEFAAFVDATGYVTDAESSAQKDQLGAGSAVFQHPVEGAALASPWHLIKDANWRQPTGAGSSIEGRDQHPVIHVSKRDAEAYADWAGGRLPSEVEWEYAASLGLPDSEDQESGAYGPDGPRANTWQGIFPIADIGTDGFQGTAPVGCYDADRLGLHDMIGNVWEWTSTPFAANSHTIKGGSYLCEANFCRRFRPAARHPQETDFSSNHIGFRIVRDPPRAEAF
ncbi:MAG: formylglycine-generating enzyme family protein [Pseudomonadota bacterium]